MVGQGIDEVGPADMAAVDRNVVQRAESRSMMSIEHGQVEAQRARFVDERLQLPDQRLELRRVDNPGAERGFAFLAGQALEVVGIDESVLGDDAIDRVVGSGLGGSGHRFGIKDPAASDRFAATAFGFLCL